MYEHIITINFWIQSLKLLYGSYYMGDLMKKSRVKIVKNKIDLNPDQINDVPDRATEIFHFQHFDFNDFLDFLKVI